MAKKNRVLVGLNPNMAKKLKMLSVEIGINLQDLDFDEEEFNLLKKLRTRKGTNEKIFEFFK